MFAHIDFGAKRFLDVFKEAAVAFFLSDEPSAEYVAELTRDYDQLSLAMCDILTLACHLTVGDHVAIRTYIEEIALLALDGDYVSNEEN